MRALKPCEALPVQASAPPRLRLADGSDAPGRNPVLEHHQALEAGLAPGPHPAYPGVVKLGILFGGSLLMWAGLIAAGAGVVSGLGR